MSQSSRAHREQGSQSQWDQRPRRDPRQDKRPPSSDRSSVKASHYSSSRPSSNPRRGQRKEHQESKWTHVCSRRGIVLICAVLTNALVLICVVAAQLVMSGMSAMGGLAAGSFDINSAYTPFEGTELQQVRDLDMQYSQMRSPGIYGGVAFSLVFGVVSLLFVVSGNKPAYDLSQKLLIGQLAFQAVGAVVYVIAVGLYLHFVIQVNSTDVCKKRERLYARQGYTWMNCSVGGADAAVALFAIITVLLYVAGAVLTAQTFRWVRRYQQDRYEAKKYAAPSSLAQRAPLRSDTIEV